jgi:two-component system, NtrC family, response regulator AtoC
VSNVVAQGLDDRPAPSRAPVGPNASCATELACRLFHASTSSARADRPLALIGQHALFVDAQERIAQFAQADSPVLISGETGSGKELFARALHLLSRRRALPYLSTNCALFQDGTLAVSQLFGHRRGSFTGAATDHTGLFEAAQSGTLFLDEIGELPLVTQAILLRAIGEGEITPLGETKVRQVDVRTVVASARDLATLVEAGTFRGDLYYRLRLLHVHVPALRERHTDIPMLARYVLACLNRQWGAHKRFDDAALVHLTSCAWPGNVRELRGTIECLFYRGARDVIGAADVRREFEPAARAMATAIVAPPGSVADFWDDLYRPFISRDLNRAQVRAILTHGLEETGGSYRLCLGRLGVSPRDYLKAMDFLRHHDLKPPQFRRRPLRRTTGRQPHE